MSRATLQIDKICCIQILYFMALALSTLVYNRPVSDLPKSPFSVNLMAQRKKKGLSQRDLAAKTGISQRMISYYESHVMVVPPMDKLKRIAEVLGVAIAELIDPDLIPRTPLELSTRTLKKVQIIEQLPLEDQRKVMAYANDLLEKNQLKGTTRPSPPLVVKEPDQPLQAAEPLPRLNSEA